MSEQEKIEIAKKILKRIDIEMNIAWRLSRNFYSRQRILDAADGKYANIDSIWFFNHSVCAGVMSEGMERRNWFFPKDDRYEVRHGY